jgi:hypothetical protein
MKGYFRVRDHSVFPSLKDTDLLLVDGAYTQVAATAPSALTLIPPSMIGPPEKVHVDMHDTVEPGLINVDVGKGRVAWIPWDLADRLNPHRQLRTDAHPLVEMTWMQQGPRRLLHLLNLTGHSDTAYFAPLPMRDIHVQVDGVFRKARSVRAPGDLPVRVEAGHTEFTIPALTDYELIVLE